MFFIYSEEEFALCPICGEPLVYHSRVKRQLKDISGETKTYCIRVLECTNKACPQTYHRELPDIIVPYRRYDAKTIETAVDHDNKDVLMIPADGSTIKRWQTWFISNEINIMMALKSVVPEIEDNAETSSLTNQNPTSKTPLETIKEIVKREVKWLNETIRILVNYSKWTFNRSAFVSG